jgi:outer membrane receptor for ferrienterochelin and colicins
MHLLNIMQGQVRGHVYAGEKDGSMPALPGVVVYWLDRSFARTTDEKGFFEIPMSPAAEPKLLFSFVGYEKDTITVSDISKPLHIMLRRGVELKTVVVQEKQKTEKDEYMNSKNVSTITTTGLKQAACCNLSESFENSSSVDVSYSDALTGAKQIQLLGLTGLYTQIMTENIPSVRGLSAPFGLTYIPGPWMESIQVSKGVASVRSGYEAMTGQINVEYKKPLLSKELYHFNVFANSEGRWEANSVINTKINDKWGSNIMFNTNQYNGTIDRNGDGFLDQPKVQSYNFANRWKYESDKLEMLAGVKFLDETRIGGQKDFRPDQPRDTGMPWGISLRTQRQEGFIKLGYIYPSRENTSTAMILSGVNHIQDGFYGLRNYNAKQQSIYANLIHTTYLFNTMHTITAGLTYMYDNIYERIATLGFARIEHVPGAYFEYDYKPGERFNLIAGARYDYNSLYGSLFTPRMHIRYEVFHNTIFKVSAGKGYRSPNILSDNSGILASSRVIYVDDKIRMEEAWNYGAILTQRYKIGGRPGSISGEFYRTDFVNQLVVDLDRSAHEVHFYNLDGKSFANSYQVENEFSPVKGFDLTLAFRVNDVQTTYSGVLRERPLVSKYKGFVNLNYGTPDGLWQFNYTVQFNGGGRIPSTESNPVAYQISDKFSPYTIMNAQILRVIGNWEVYLGCENLTDFVMPHPVLAYDQPYGQNFDASMIWGPLMGRKFYGGVRYSFKVKNNKKE